MGDRWWSAVEQAAASLPPIPGRSGDPRSALEAWCRRAGAERMVRSKGDLAPAPADGVTCLGLPGTLETSENPQHVLEVVADAVGQGGHCVAAVSWMGPAPAGSRRSLHPASMIGLLAERFAVSGIDVADGLLGVTARVEGDPDQRLVAGKDALLKAQPAIEAQLDRVALLQGQLDALWAAHGALQEAVTESDRAHFTTRRARNVARARLRDERDAVGHLQQRLEQLEEELKAAGARADALADRLAEIEGSRWWRSRDIVMDARRKRLGIVRAVPRLWRLRKTPR